MFDASTFFFEVQDRLVRDDHFTTPITTWTFIIWALPLIPGLTLHTRCTFYGNSALWSKYSDFLDIQELQLYENHSQTIKIRQIQHRLSIHQCKPNVSNLFLKVFVKSFHSSFPESTYKWRSRWTEIPIEACSSENGISSRKILQR